MKPVENASVSTNVLLTWKGDLGVSAVSRLSCGGFGSLEVGQRDNVRRRTELMVEENRKSQMPFQSGQKLRSASDLRLSEGSENAPERPSFHHHAHDAGAEMSDVWGDFQINVKILL